MEGIEYVKPGEIEARSFAIIEEELKERGLVIPEEQKPVTKRVIHTTADFDYVKTMVYAPDAIETAKKLILQGADIVTGYQYGACRDQQTRACAPRRGGALFYGR